jgi:ATP-dependent helicase/nuclease subunit A
MSAELYAFRRNVVLVASAGTGKTHALVGVIVHALLGCSDLGANIEPARVAATTFSRKAAAEIRSRLVTELERLAFGTTSPYATDLDAAAKRLSIAWDSATCQSRARRVLAGIEHATIGTLHSVAYTIARAHALTVGLPPSFAVASEDESEAWANDAVAMAMTEHAQRDGDAIRDLFRLMRGSDRAQAELVRLLGALEEDGRPASALVLPEGDDEALSSRMEALVSRARDLVADSSHGDAASAVLAAHEEGDVHSLAEAAGDLLSVRKTRGEESPVSMRDGLPGSSNRDKGEILAHAWAARERIAPTAALVRDLLARSQELLADAHARAGAVGFGAALRLARDALRDDPRAAARVSSSFDALLVDEFQDTSRVQVDLLRLLWERDPRSRAPGAMPVVGDLRPRGLLVVGDRKQSIYAFRGADVAVFVSTCVELAGERACDALDVPRSSVQLPARTTADLFALRENHRSNAAIIEFVNAFSRECLRADGDDLSEARYAESVESLVPSPRTVMPTDKRVTWLRPPGEARDTTRLDDATIAATYIARSVFTEHGDDGEPLAYRDFAILAQSNEMLDAAAFALSRAGIPHVVAGRGFFAAREVQDLLALLRFVDRPDDRAALLAVLRGPFAALSDRTLLGLTEPHRGLVTDLERWDVLERRGFVEDEDRDALERVRSALRALRRSADRLGPGRTLREAVRELEIEQTLLLLPRGIQRIANVRKLLRIADEEATIRALLDRVALAEARAREPEAATFADDDDAVRLVTMHASKGLAFRVVILPELKARPVQSPNTMLGIDLRSDPPRLATKLLDDRGEPITVPSLVDLVARDRARLRADRRRLFYVAVTRARERIVFVGDAKVTGRGDPSLGALVSTLAQGGFGSAHVEMREAAIEEAPAIGPRPDAPDLVLAPPNPPRTIEVAIAPTALQDFHHCARRFELVHLVALPEPTPTALGRFREDGAPATNARAEGDALHRVLEHAGDDAFGAADAADRARAALAACDAPLEPEAEARVLRAATRFLESDYARAVRAAGARTWRERPFVVGITSAETTVTLRGAMDLVVLWPNGDVDVVDYKRARGPDPRPHALQLDVYALAARELATDGARIRAGAAFLGGEGAMEPRFRPPIDAPKLEAHLSMLAKNLVEARRRTLFTRAPAKTCHAIGCGYFTLCHPARDRKQLTLFR